MFVHTSAPVTFDVGAEYDSHHTIYSGDELLDLFVFLGEPKDVVSEYTAITGRSPVPPLWSFGLWMSRITYKSEAEVRDVAAKLRQYKVPADVLHLDTGWFETDWRSDYQFSKSRFTDPAKMIADLKKDGFHISLWQYTYFTPKNALWKELVDQDLAVKDQGGRLATEDAVLDFTNPKAVAWYKAKVGALLKMGVSVIKADFGEGAPLEGIYANGRTGWYEHNLYPVRYNEAVWDLTKQITGDGIIWGRSAWAGSQRYPLHWGGDAENTQLRDGRRAARRTLVRALGLHLLEPRRRRLRAARAGRPLSPLDGDGRADVAHAHARRAAARAVGVRPRDAHRLPARARPALLADAVHLLAGARRVGEGLADAAHAVLRVSRTIRRRGRSRTSTCSARTCSSRRCSPTRRRAVASICRPAPGSTTSRARPTPAHGGTTSPPARCPIVLLVKDHTVLPHVAVAQSTAQIDWKNVELRTFSTDGAAAEGTFILPGGTVQTLRVNGASLVSDPLAGRVTWRVTRPTITPSQLTRRDGRPSSALECTPSHPSYVSVEARYPRSWPDYQVARYYLWASSLR